MFDKALALRCHSHGNPAPHYVLMKAGGMSCLSTNPSLSPQLNRLVAMVGATEARVLTELPR